MKAGFLAAGIVAITVALAGAAPALAAGGTDKARSVKPTPARVSVTMQKGKRVVRNAASKRRLAARPDMPAFGPDGSPLLRSAAVLVADEATGEVLYAKNPSAVVPIASITKLMTAMVVLDAQQRLGDVLTVTEEDIDWLRGSRSRLAVGAELTREDMLRLALMSSENRAASSLSRHYPGGRPSFVLAMNRKAAGLGLADTRFADPTGLDAGNVSSAADLAKMVAAAASYPLIREFSTLAEYEVVVSGRARVFRNTNALVRNDDWEIALSKTGYINEAGKCLVMQAWFDNRPMIIVLLDSVGRLTRIGDANRIKRWLESVVLAGREI